jgi:hypothetical protein
MHETPIDLQLPILDELGQALHERAFASEQRTAPHEHSRVRSTLARLMRRPLVALPLLAVLGGGVALAATGVLRPGSPVPATAHLTPDAQLGVPLPGRSRLISRSAPDPAGGAPWSMRIVHTTRNVVCTQIARVYDGQLGVIGEDGAFHDDGRFHALPLDAISPVPRHYLVSCQPAGQRTTQEVSGMPASGQLSGAGTLGKPAQERRLYFGLLGPTAVSVSYRLPGRTVTLPVEPGSGAYLIVLPSTTPAPKTVDDGGRTGVGPFVPAGALTKITYRLGRGLCEERPIGSPRGPHPCPRRAALGLPSRPRDLHRQVHVTLRAIRGRLPIRVRLADGRPLPPPAHAPVGVEYEATVTFLAPFAVTNAQSGYSIEVPSHCRGGGAEGTALERDVRAGEVVHARTHAFPSPCGKRATIEVYYHAHASSPLPIPREETLVGTAIVKRP